MTGQEFTMEIQMSRMHQIMTQTYADPELLASLTSATPQKMHHDLLTTCPVRRIDDFYSLQTRADIAYVNKQPSVEQGCKYLGSDRPAVPLGLDGPEHRKFRRLLDPVFTAKRVAPLAEKVRTAAGEMIDEFIGDGRVDAFDRWCEPLPSRIFLSIMGLPVEDLPGFLNFKRLTLNSDRVAADSSAEQRARMRLEAIQWIHDYINRDLDAREREPEQRDDVIGWLLGAEVDGQRLSREELLDILGLLMIAGLDTVASSLACILSYLARHPEHRARIVAEPELMPTAVEELMRFESPVTEGFRITDSDLTLPSGTTIPAGSWMHLSWAAANLDPAAFDNPLEVDLERRPNPHIGFANGFHRCLGSHLARLELHTALAVWHERIPDYSIASGTELVYTTNPRAPRTLPLVWQ
jgi:cytochrome P450